MPASETASEPASETETLPSPLVPVEVDLRDFPFTPFFRARLFSSAFHANVTDAEWRAGVTLWLKSWDQAPAGSLPADDVALCRLAELGRDLKSWRKIRSGALTGWTPCSDGRLYHKVVAEGVLTAWDGKLKQRWRNECARLKKAGQRGDGRMSLPSFEEWRASYETREGIEPTCPAGQSDMSPGTEGDVCADVPGDVPGDNASKRKREGQGKREGEGEEKREKGSETATTTATSADTARSDTSADASGVGGGEVDDLDPNDAKRDGAAPDAVKVEQEACSPGAGPASSSGVPPAGQSAAAATPASTSSDQAPPTDRAALLRAASILRARLETELNLPIPVVTAPILSWLQAGVSAELIEATIADVRAQNPGFTPVSIAYFGPAIARAQAAAQAMAKAVAAAPVPGLLLRASSTSPPPGPPRAAARFDPVSFIKSGAASRRP